MPVTQDGGKKLRGKRKAPIPHSAHEAAVGHVTSAQKDKSLRPHFPRTNFHFSQSSVFIQPLSVLDFWDRQSSETQRPMGARRVNNRQSWPGVRQEGAVETVANMRPEEEGGCYCPLQLCKVGPGLLLGLLIS